MSYYNKNHEKLELKSMTFLDNGCCADVFYDNDIIFKKYYKKIDIENRIDENIFKLLKSIDSPHLIKLIDIYSNFKFSELLQYSNGKMDFKIDGYTAKYYKENNTNIFLETKDYLLENINGLEYLFEILSKNYVYTDDLKRKNTILGKDKIVIIDPDLFGVNMNFSKEFISLYNKIKLLELLKNIVRQTINVYEDKKYSEIIDDLFEIPITNNTSLASEFSKKLSYVKKPIELFRKY